MTAPKDIVIFESTIVDDRSRGSAEHEFGADIAITATVGDTKVTIKNAIWVKRNGAGKGRIRVSDFEDLEEQINKMRQYACNPKVLLLYEYAGRRVSRVVSGNIILKERDTKGYSLENYFSAPCIDYPLWKHRRVFHANSAGKLLPQFTHPNKISQKKLKTE